MIFFRVVNMISTTNLEEPIVSMLLSEDGGGKSFRKFRTLSTILRDVKSQTSAICLLIAGRHSRLMFLSSKKLIF